MKVWLNCLCAEDRRYLGCTPILPSTIYPMRLARIHGDASRQYRLLDIFGKIVMNVNGGDWNHHQKGTDSAFRESNCALLWAESRNQVQQMRNNILERGRSSMLETKYPESIAFKAN
jgi:hypothetical protein